MNDDELKKLWQQQPVRVPEVSAAQLISAMQNKSGKFRRTIKARDLRELLGCVFIVIIFGIYCFTFYRTPISRLGGLIVIASTFFIAWKLIHTRRSTPPAPPDATTVESLRAELNSVRAQSRLLGSVLWWYILPGFIGLVVATWGMGGSLVVNIVCTVFFVAVDGFIYWLNRRARSKQLLPLESQLEALLRSAETGEPLDETSVAGLRTIALSLAAAEKVKPVEFKVTLWQIALFGEIGFIGMWFFLMLGLTLSNDKWRTEAEAPQAVVESARADQTNRFSVVARKVIDLLNARDYDGVQKLYNPAMSEVFPPKETSEFYTRLATGFGNIEKIVGPTGNGFRGWTAFQLHCQRGELIMSLSLDANDKISGIHFRPAPRPLNIGSFVRHLFRWQHLVWLVPFFLAGLAYSRIMQKTTERAVGISTLGIHLSKGQNLYLWDEIKEIRTFRLLHIRSLWLIKESGEKTMMPWTSLERRSDLRAAVESFAPANHPIREYLALLRRI